MQFGFLTLDQHDHIQAKTTTNETVYEQLNGNQQPTDNYYYLKMQQFN